MNRKYRTFIAAFSVTMLLFGGFCGFAAVDLSTERYMPGRFGPFFEIYGVNAAGAEFAFMSRDYSLDFAPFKELPTKLAPYRGLLPQAPRVAALIAAKGMERIQDAHNPAP